VRWRLQPHRAPRARCEAGVWRLRGASPTCDRLVSCRAARDSQTAKVNPPAKVCVDATEPLPVKREEPDLGRRLPGRCRTPACGESAGGVAPSVGVAPVQQNGAGGEVRPRRREHEPGLPRDRAKVASSAKAPVPTMPSRLLPATNGRKREADSGMKTVSRFSRTSPQTRTPDTPPSCAGRACRRRDRARRRAPCRGRPTAWSRR
jgi:hypothetical protein